MKSNIYFATDHAGFELKNTILKFVRDELGYEVFDCGALDMNDSDDYPDFVHVAAQAVQDDPANRMAIVFGHSGQGEAMVANRYPAVRAAVYYGCQKEIVTLSREHNNANVLSVSAHFVDDEEAREVVRLWLETEFSGDDRHSRRISKLDVKR